MNEEYPLLNSKEFMKKYAKIKRMFLKTALASNKPRGDNKRKKAISEALNELAIKGLIPPHMAKLGGL